MKKIQVILIYVLICVVVGYAFIYSSKKITNTCKYVYPVSVTKNAQVIDNSKREYATSSKQVLGESTDGGVQINYLQNGKLLLIEKGLFSETIKSNSSYFINDNYVYYLHEEITRYENSIYREDFNPNDKTVEIRDYYLDSNQNLCYWYIDNILQKNDSSSIKEINHLISSLDIK